MKTDAKEYLLSLQAEVRDIISQFENNFAELDVHDLIWKPSSEKWSIIECIEHINISNKIYMIDIKSVLEDQNIDSGKLPEQYKSTIFGNFLANSLAPKNGKITRKLKTAKFLEPSIFENDTAPVIFEFRKQQNELLEMLDKAKQVDINKIKIPSFIKIFKLNIGDAFRVMINHEKRHLLQAKYVTKFDKFPK